MKNVLAVLSRNHRPDERRLSEYVDGALAPAQAEAVASHVVTCATCTQRLAELRALRTMLAELPETDAPRSFRLRPSDVAAVPRAAPRASFAARLMPAMSATAAAAFVVLLALSFSGIGEQHHTADVASTQARTQTDAGAPANSTNMAPVAPAAGAPQPTAAAGAGPAPAAAAAGAQSSTPAAAATDDFARPSASPSRSEFAPSAGTSAPAPASTSVAGDEKSLARPESKGADAVDAPAPAI
ncbi:MAG TPA: zf-HC2 domain-containing protein, partial [Dehalococcoidia bacterium]|nr:zf-HC2 domain-containing protein [Dehalococcoidia bacterium]